MDKPAHVTRALYAAGERITELHARVAELKMERDAARKGCDDLETALHESRARVAELEAMERRAKFYAHEPVARYILGEA